MTKLYLMRHGETLFNTQKRVQGACDSPLTKLGIEQAKLAKGYFDEKDIHFDDVYASTQERATDTAKLVGDREQVDQLKGLKEMNFGQFEAQPEMLLPKFREGAISFEDLLVPFGGEDIRQVGKRVHLAIQDVLGQSTAQNILMVSHGAAMWGLMLELAISFPPGVYFSNCAICQFDVGEDASLELEKLILPTQDFKVYDF
ncbi:histidine phosphatase family protein [Streptococcus pluranimalium]|uniref:histidine phosphatase family protein n=1 Tax=Streptococcus pluranimalium TaxID=82348 RepID=UPI0024156169|nr:histidine phosphatase family protein [Streptococcus pluranimalium]MDY3024932.1 histidine phosphatase family protein [Streptococcus hyovaginalis]WFM80496.1 histidine phosphatase family protein [Streptococcus pluranimalium]HEM6115878.1 histidine phosphatase family protein [Streptococcus suis]